MCNWDFGPWRVSQFWVTITLVVQTHRQIFQDIVLYYNLSFCKILQTDFWTDLESNHNKMIATEPDDLLALTANILITLKDFEVTRWNYRLKTKSLRYQSLLCFVYKLSHNERIWLLIPLPPSTGFSIVTSFPAAYFILIPP